MADYSLPEYVEKRVRYFDGQFLQDKDFTDEQNYQRDREHRIDRLLHGPGVADGLMVTSSVANQVTVAPGAAVDGNGYQLVLASATKVDLPGGEFNGKQGATLYISYLETPVDPQTVGGSGDYTRWLERPVLTALPPGQQHAGTGPPVLLATLGLDDAGRVTIDNTVRTYSGLRMPGSSADAVTMRATSAGPVRIDGSLTVDENVGVGTGSPRAKLEVAGRGGMEVDLLVSGRLRSGNNDGGLWVGENCFVGGFHASKIGFWTAGTWRLAVLGDGKVGIGTESPRAKLEVAGRGGTEVDLLVKGRLRSDNNDGGLWVGENCFVGGFDTGKIGFWTAGTWRLAVLGDGKVGIGTTQPTASLHLHIPQSASPVQALQIDARSFNTPQTARASALLSVRDLGAGPGGKTQTHFIVRGDGNVGIGVDATQSQRLVVDGSTWLKGDLFVEGRLVYWWKHDRPPHWKVIENGPNNWARSYNTDGPNTSDVRLKSDLRPLSGALDLVRKLRGVRYRWGQDGLSHFTRDVESSVSAGPDATAAQERELREETRAKARAALAGDRIGLVAQDVETVLPELIYADEDGYKHVRYQHLTALLTEAIKEQDAAMRALSAEVAALRARQ